MESAVAAKGANWEPQLPDGKAFMRWITACPLVASFECGFCLGQVYKRRPGLNPASDSLTIGTVGFTKELLHRPLFGKDLKAL